IYGDKRFEASKTVRDEANKLHDDFGSTDGVIPPTRLDRRLRYVSRITGNIVVVGVPDGFRIVNGKIQVLEFKTVAGHWISENLEDKGAIQLQIYVWMLKK
ncbi:hypothetical protein GTO27_03715, partial [Candidatus Bathyarchaeota archaeon]|nr:hypothetical protein [Candidatus Bathyarchaeota archaeon]